MWTTKCENVIDESVGVYRETKRKKKKNNHVFVITGELKLYSSVLEIQSFEKIITPLMAFQKWIKKTVNCSNSENPSRNMKLNDFHYTFDWYIKIVKCISFQQLFKLFLKETKF